MEINMAFRHILLNVRFILIMIIILSTAKFTKNDTELNYNVSNDIHLTPLHYDVQIKFDVHTNVFLGKCNIIMQINRPTKNITIMSSGIFDIIEIDLINKDNNKTINIHKISFINKTNINLNFFQLSRDFLSPGTYILKMIYVRHIILDDGDFFESAYRDKEKVLSNEGIHIIKAEELLPCWDESEIKSTFNISIYHHKNYKVLSNMLIREKLEDMNNMLWTHFDKSLSMSAQQLTIIVINTVTTSFINKIVSSTINVTFWYRKEIIDQVQLAETIAKTVVYFLEKKNIKEVPEIHYIAIKDPPHSYRKIWGSILLREEDIVYDTTLDHIARKIKVANLIAHQTISYWYDDVFLWSKGGFIMFLAAHILNETQLIYRMTDLFVVQIQQESLRLDTLPNTDSLSLYTANISTVYSFRPSFDYYKSSIIWRMLYYLISDDVFWTSIKTFISLQYHPLYALQTDIINRYGYNLSINFMQEFFDNSNNPYNLNLMNIMNTWITEKQYPQLFVERNYWNSNTKFSMNITSTFDEGAEYSTLVTYATKSNDHGSFLFYQPSSSSNKNELWTIFTKQFDKNDWIIVNLQQSGYYRVNYNTENWNNLADYLHYENLTGIHILNRAQIIDDAFYFSMQRELNFTMFWNITRFLLFKDTDYVVWYPLIKAVEYMTCIWPVQNIAVIKNKIKEMFYRLLLRIEYYDVLDFESHFTKYLREEAVKWACVLDAPRCREKAAYELEMDVQGYVQNRHLRWKEWVYCKGLMTANHNIWVKVYEKCMKTNDNTLLEYLTCSTNPDINRIYLRKTMELEFTSKVSNNRMCANIVLLIIAKHARNDIVLEFIFEQLENIRLSLRKQLDHIAIFIVIITHEHSVEQFMKITTFVKSTMTDKRLVDAIQQKIKKRKNEYNRQVRWYGEFSN